MKYIGRWIEKMRITKRPMVLVAILIFLYIAPMIFTPSSYSSSIVEQPSMTKEFSSSEYLDESPYSIDGFSETLEDDVFYSADGWYDDEIMPATAGGPIGTGNWYEVETINGDGDDNGCWIAQGANVEYCQFEGKGFTIEGFDYKIYGRSQSENASLATIDTIADDFGLIINLTRSDVGGTYFWHNGTYIGPLSADNTHVTFFSLCDIDPLSTIVIDYMEITFYYLPYLKPFASKYTNWGSSFTNITNLEFGGISSGLPSYSCVSNGDIATITIDLDDGSDEYAYYQYTSLDIPTDTYLEVRYKTNTQGALYVQLSDGSHNQYVLSGEYSTNWKTTKIWLGQFASTLTSNIVTVKLFCSDYQNSYSAFSSIVYLDYIRISPSDEMGFQDNCANIEHVNGADGATISSNGDFITLVADASAYANFTIDTTTTQSYIDPTYYPFIEIKIHSNDVGNDLQLKTLTAGGARTILSRFTTTTNIIHANILAYGDYDYYAIQIWGFDNETTRIDYIRPYSIANYSYSAHASTTVQDYAYVSGGILIFSRDTSYWMALNHDPSINVPTGTYNLIELTTSTITEGGTDDMYFTEYETGDADSYFTSTIYPVHTTIDDFAIGSYGDYGISSITFIDNHHWRVIDTISITFQLPQWHVIDTVSVIFYLVISTGKIDMWLAIIGMFLIPTSTCYLAYGGRKNFSTDKLFYGLVLFILGWGFLLGGIF